MCKTEGSFGQKPYHSRPVRLKYSTSWSLRFCACMYLSGKFVSEPSSDRTYHEDEVFTVTRPFSTPLYSNTKVWPAYELVCIMSPFLTMPVGFLFLPCTQKMSKLWFNRFKICTPIASLAREGHTLARRKNTTMANDRNHTGLNLILTLEWVASLPLFLTGPAVDFSDPVPDFSTNER